MKVIIAPDKFKGSLTAAQVCEAIERGVRDIWPGAIIESIPLADGGEGTCEVLTRHAAGQFVTCRVTGPRFEPRTATYGIDRQRKTAIIEMASASGLMLLRGEEWDPLETTTFGTGELIRHALEQGIERVILGLGGSATNDAGLGMAAALGYTFLDGDGQPLKPIGASLSHLRAIDAQNVHPGLSRAEIIALCDVRSPLYGPQGAAYVYARQKGADDASVAKLDRGLRNFSKVVDQVMGLEANFEGAGAAGGLGAGAKVFLDATLWRGTSFVMEAVGMPERINRATLIFTGEGRLDEQTLSGKVVSAVCQLGREAKIPVIAVCGINDLPREALLKLGLFRVIPLADSTTSAIVAMEHAAALISSKVKSALETHSIH